MANMPDQPINTPQTPPGTPNPASAGQPPAQQPQAAGQPSNPVPPLPPLDIPAQALDDPDEEERPLPPLDGLSLSLQTEFEKARYAPIVADADQAFMALKAKMQAQAAALQAVRPKNPIGFGAEYLAGPDFGQDVADRAASMGNNTGFAGLDRIIGGLDPGLYVLGGIPSVGKSGWAVNLANRLAAMGRHVLYICLEQSKLDYYSRSLAALFFQTHLEEALAEARRQGLRDKYAYYYPHEFSKYPTPSAIEIQRGIAGKRYPREMAEQINRYIQTIGNKACVIQGDFGVSVEHVWHIVKLYIEIFGIRPVVVIDYMQIMEPTKENGRTPDSKTAMDHIGKELKEILLDLGATVIAISSLNRMNYLAPISLEAFKESGGIEYSADVMWGLQLSIMNHKGFNNKIGKDGTEGKETSLTHKRELIKESKKMSPRRIQLSCLKNRFGIASYETEFLYYPASDYFHSVLSPAFETFEIKIDEKHPIILPPPPIPRPSNSTATFENPDGGDKKPEAPAKGADGSDLTDEELAELSELAADSDNDDGQPPEGSAKLPYGYDCGQVDY